MFSRYSRPKMALPNGYHDPYANLNPAERAMWLYDPYAHQPADHRPKAPRLHPRPLMESAVHPYSQPATHSGYGAATAYGTVDYGSAAQGYGASMPYTDPYRQEPAPYQAEDYNERYGPGYGGPVKPVMNFFGGRGGMMAKKGAKHTGSVKEIVKPTKKALPEIQKKKKQNKDVILIGQKKPVPSLSPPKPIKTTIKPAALTSGTEGYVKENKITFYKLDTPVTAEKENTEKKAASPVKQQEPLLAIGGEIPDFLRRSMVLTETRKRKIRYRMGLWCRIVGWEVESVFKTNGWYATAAEPSKYTARVVNFYPEIFTISACGTVFEEVSYKLVTNWLEMWYFKGILSDKMIFNIYEKDKGYSSPIFQVSKRCFLTLIDEVLKEALPNDLKTGLRPFTDEEKHRMDEAFKRAAERISKNDLAPDDLDDAFENGP